MSLRNKTDNAHIKLKDALTSKNGNSAVIDTSKRKNNGTTVQQTEGYEEKGRGYTEKKNTGKKESKPRNKITEYTRNYVRNPLHDFQSYNCIFTLAALTLEEVNFPDVLYNRAPKFPVAQSAGKTGPEVTFYGNYGLNLEYLIDDVEISAAVTPGPKNKHTQFTDLRFTIKEPFSMGLFFQALNVQAAKANNDPNVNYIYSTYGLIIDFVGTDVNGKIFNNTKLRKVLPFQFKQASLRASVGGAEYDCEGSPVTEYGLLTVNNQIKTDITLSGSTVYEMMQVGDDSLMAQLNKKGDDKKAKQKQQQQTQLPTDDYVIYFPTKDSLNMTAEQSAKRRSAILEDRAGNSADQGAAVYYSKFNIEQDDVAVQSILGKNVIVTNEFNAGGKGIRVFQAESKENYSNVSSFLGNEIGRAKMDISDGNMQIIGKSFPDFQEQYDKGKKVFTRNKIKLDLKKMTLSFEKGSYITDIIETVILLSDYSKDLAKGPNELLNVNPGHRKWFRIITKCFELKDSFVQQVTKKNPKIMLFNVVPYQVPDDLFIDPTSYSSSTVFIKENIVKGYNYIYTGLNEDILDFQLDYNFSFFQSVPHKTDKSAQTSETGKGKSHSTSTVQSEDTYRFQGRALELVGSTASVTTQFGDPKAGYGTENESLELKVARSMNDRIINSNADLLELDLTIIGDPYFLPTSSMMNSDEPTRTYVDPRTYFTKDGQLTETGKSYYGNGRGEINHQDQMCFIDVVFQTPIDIHPDGSMIFPKDGTYQNGVGEKVRLGEFSGYYKVTEIVSSFRSGKFTQVLKVVRNPITMLDAKQGTKENKNVLQVNSNLGSS